MGAEGGGGGRGRGGGGGGPINDKRGPFRSEVVRFV